MWTTEPQPLWLQTAQGGCQWGTGHAGLCGDKSQGPGIASTQASGQYGKPHLGHPEVGSPHLGSHLSRELALYKPGANNPGPCPPTVPNPAKDSVHTPPLPPPKMEEVGLGTSY